MHRVLAVHCHHLRIEPDKGSTVSFPTTESFITTAHMSGCLRQDEVVGRPALWHQMEHEWPDIFAAAKTLEFEKDGAFSRARNEPISCVS
jgi:hypothetical protein